MLKVSFKTSRRMSGTQPPRSSLITLIQITTNKICRKFFSRHKIKQQNIFLHDPWGILRSLPLGNSTFGKLPLGKLSLGKLSLGKLCLTQRGYLPRSDPLKGLQGTVVNRAWHSTSKCSRKIYFIISVKITRIFEQSNGVYSIQYTDTLKTQNQIQ